MRAGLLARARAGLATEPKTGREQRAVQGVVRRGARPRVRPAGPSGAVDAQLRPAPDHELRRRLPLPAATATVPWLGTAGTYPSPPPPPPPPDEDLLIAAWIYFAATLFVFVCFLICAVYRTGGYHDSRNYIAYWCCCLLPCLVRGTHDDSWDNSEPGARSSSVSIPSLSMK